jgi:hypothetical protein
MREAISRLESGILALGRLPVALSWRHLGIVEGGKESEHVEEEDIED